MSLSDETKETVATIDRVVFGNENPDCNFIRILLHNFYDQQCLMCRELSSEEGADYEAFILALDLWNSVNEERDKIKNLLMHYVTGLMMVGWSILLLSTPYLKYVGFGAILAYHAKW